MRSRAQVWLLRGRKTGSLRAVVLNKAGGGRECAADIRLTAEQLARYAAQATGRYMYVSGGLSDRCGAQRAGPGCCTMRLARQARARSSVSSPRRGNCMDG